MGLSGRLEDLPLLDILQIVSFSQKTGYLWLEGAQGRGAVLCRNGRVICSYSWSTLDYLRIIEAGKYKGSRDKIVQEQIEISLRELMSLREGTFQFELTDELPSVLEGVDISTYLQEAGVNPEHLLLEVATELDKDRRDTAALIESSTQEGQAIEAEGEQYASDLRSFSETIRQQLETMIPDDGSSEKTFPDLDSSSDDGSFLLEFLASMTEQLINPRRPTDISRMVLQVAARYLERGILFLVKHGKVRGLAGFGLSGSGEESHALARKLDIEVANHGPFAEVVKKRKTLRPGLDELESSLYSHISRGRADECTLAPMLNNGEVLTILYGDNAGSGKKLGKMGGLELFMAQAGMALELARLQRRLKSLGAKLEVGQPTPT
jgi:hypothetical protein